MAKIFDVFKYVRPRKTIKSDDFNGLQDSIKSSFDSIGTALDAGAPAGHLGVSTPLHVGEPLDNAHATTKTYVDGVVDTSDANATATAADLVATNQDTIDTAADLVATNADVVSTNADVVTTGTNVTAAQTAKTAAQTAKTAAETAKAAAEAALDSFDDRYLGAKTSEPTVDNDGNALLDGALFFDTTVNAMKVYDLGGTAWIAIHVQAKADIEALEIDLKSGGSTKLTTSSSGIDVTGSVTADGLTLSGTNDQILSLDSADGGAVYHAYKHNGTRTGYIGHGSAESTDMHFVNETARNILFYTDSSERLRIDSTGNVGIGTSSPSAKLEVRGTSKLGNTVTQSAPSATDIMSTAHTLLGGTGGNGTFIGQYPSAQGYATWIQSSFNNPTTAKYNLVLNPLGGNVGIGTSLLNSNKVVIEGGIAGTSSSTLALKTGSGANSKVADLAFYGTFVTPTVDQGQRRTADITSGFSTGNWGNEYLAFGVGGAGDGSNLTTERLRILSTGGITFNGDTAQANALDDYETGSIPDSSIKVGGTAISSLTGNYSRYVKIGNQVTVFIKLQGAVTTTVSGAFEIGLPFTAPRWQQVSPCVSYIDSSIASGLMYPTDRHFIVSDAGNISILKSMNLNTLESFTAGSGTFWLFGSVTYTTP